MAGLLGCIPIAAPAGKDDLEGVLPAAWWLRRSSHSMGQVPKKAKNPNQFVLTAWMASTNPVVGEKRLILLEERAGARTISEAAFRETVKDHLAGLSIVHRIKGYKRSLAFIRTKMPRPIRVRSGDCGEILATEYIEQCTEFKVPIKRLRWKDDRDTTMRGDDVIALRKAQTRWRMLKAEAKSRAVLGSNVVEEAVNGLNRNAGRPNPSSLGFISARLRELGRDEEARVLEALQESTPRAGEIEHLVFTLSANDPTNHLKKHVATATDPCQRHLVGCVIGDHQDFINSVFDKIHRGG